jgi:hypothetical protein
MRLTGKQLTLEFGRHDRDAVEPTHDAADRLAAVARLLPAEDRRLIDMLFVRRLSHRAAATELRVAPGVISRRMLRLRNLFGSPTIRAIADHIDSLATPIRQVAIDHFFNRISIPLLCERHGTTRREMQAQLDYIRGWARGLHRAALSVSDLFAREEEEV